MRKSGGAHFEVRRKNGLQCTTTRTCRSGRSFTDRNGPTVEGSSIGSRVIQKVERPRPTCIFTVVPMQAHWNARLVMHATDDLEQRRNSRFVVKRDIPRRKSRPGATADVRCNGIGISGRRRQRNIEILR